MRGNERGFTLIEFLVAITILAVGLLGLLQVVNVAMGKNLENMYRVEAIQLADDRMMQKRSMPFLSITTAHSDTFLRNTRGISKSYAVQEAINPVASRSKEIVINVLWTNKGNNYSHSISSVISSF
jgi:type IV pilus assembly protein PilV